MLIALLAFILTSPQSSATSVQCHTLFQIKKAPSLDLQDIEDPAAWYTAFKQNDKDAKKTLQAMIKTGKTNLHKGTYLPQHQNFFRFIVNLKGTDLAQLSPSNVLDIFTLFSMWNLSPPREFQNDLWTTINLQLPRWTPEDFLTFALARKLNPITPSQKFLASWKSEILKNISHLNATTQLEILGAELLHQTTFSSAQTRYLLATVTDAVLAQQKPFSIKSLKEMFRGLLVLRAMEPTQFFAPMVKLEAAIDLQLRAQGLSLDQAGRSGDPNSEQLRGVPWRRVLVEQELNMTFGFSPKIYEYSKTSHLGFFDPVDLYFPDLHLVIEWDGRHHYFNKLDSEAKIIQGHEHLILRPIDRARDAILRRHGNSILRISMELNRELETTEILDLIKRQNPDFKEEENRLNYLDLNL